MRTVNPIENLFQVFYICFK